MSPRPLAALFAALATCLPALAQGVYYVDGLTGLDAPGRGTTAAAPWRTITYAMANATPPAAGVATIRIQGGQSYAPASNGETYPVTLAPNVALEGVAAGGSLPVLAVPAGVTGLQLAPITNHPSPGMVHRNFVVQGGAIGFDLGAVFGVSHVATVEGCEFRGQSTACLQSSPRTGSNDLTVRRCKLDGLNNGGIGITQDSTSQQYPGPQHNLLVTGCSLRNLSRGVSVDSSLHPSWNYTTTIEGTTIEACGTGLRFTTPAASSGSQVKRTTLTVSRTRITDCNSGIYTAELPPSGATNSLDVTDVAVARCLTGAVLRTYGAYSSLLPQSSFRSTWTRSLFANCGKAVDLAMNCDGRMTARFQGTDFLSNGDNVVGATQFGNYTVELSGCRILDGSSGIALSGAFQTWKPTLTMTDCLIGRHAGVGISVNEGILDVTSSTIADTATAIVNTATRGTVTACLFSGNATDVQVNNPVGFPWPFLSGACATDSATTVPGGSNLQFASVGLQRPNLKLARSSPCIDRIGIIGTDYEGDPRGVATNAGATVFGDIGADEYVPTGSLRRYGLPTYGAVPASPTIGSPNTTAVLGGSYTVQLAGAIAGSLPFLATGVEDVAAPLPNELGLIGLPGCHLWLDPIVLQTLPLVGASSATSAAVAIPNQPALLGFVLAHQWLVGLPLPDGFVTSDALRVTIGQ